MNHQIKVFLITVFLSFFTNSIQAQNTEDFVFWSPDGMIVFVSDAALSEDDPANGRIASIIYRQLEGESGFSEIARVSRAENLDELAERGGTNLVEALMDQVEVTTRQELWEYIQNNPELENYGFLVFEQDFRVAFGIVYEDVETANFATGEAIRYRVTYLMEDGSESDVVYEGESFVGRQPRILAPVNISYIKGDSLVGGQWASPVEGSEEAMFANVYRQTDPAGDFERLPAKLMATRSAETDVIVYEWHEATVPEQWFRFYVEPVDLVGNPGPVSDTLLVTSINYDNVPLMGEVAVTDSSAGIHLSWEQLPQKSWLTGIEIRRSRDSRGDYIVLDTLSIAATEFLDTRMIPNVSYYYEFRVVTLQQATTLPSAIASGSFENKSVPPNAPYGLRAEQEGEHIRLTWESVEEQDLFAYYVLRGTSRYDSLVTVSRAITDSLTFLDANELLDGRTNYVYAVKAVNRTGLESEFSNRVTIRPNRDVRPPAPVSLSGYGERNRIRIHWRDLRNMDMAIAGYHVYRSVEPMDEQAANELTDVTEYPDIERLTDSLLTANSFDDLDIQPGQTAYYAFSAVDIFGVESGLSPFFEVRAEESELAAPGQVSVRQINGRLEVRWNQTHQAGATGYRIYRRSRGENEPVVSGNVSLEETTFTDQNAMPGQFYWYSVAVVAGDRESPASEEQSIRIGN